MKPVSKLVGRKSKMSSLVQIAWSKDTVKLLDHMKRKWPQRIEEAKLFFLLDVANYMKKQLIGNGVSISIGDDKWEYADDLCIGILEESKDKDVIALYSHSVQEDITIKNKMDRVLYFRARKDSPQWVYVLINYGPWPAYLLPVKVSSRDAIIISRKGRSDEIVSLSGDIMGKKDHIEMELSASGAGDVSIDPGDVAVGMKPIVDMGNAVMRGELGFISGSDIGSWRSVFANTKLYAAECMKKVSAYIVDGKKNIFDLPDEDDKINESVIRDGLGFAKEIGKFLK